jgi:hypothetical protein
MWDQVIELTTQQLALTENLLASLDSDTCDDCKLLLAPITCVISGH